MYIESRFVPLIYIICSISDSYTSVYGTTNNSAIQKRNKIRE